MKTERSLLIPAARDLLRLAQKDRAAARRVMAELSAPEQVAAICEAPLGMRASILDLAPEPEVVIPLMPEAELCFTCRHLGVSEASWLLRNATPEQIVACVDLDAWDGLLPERRRLDDWFASLAEAGDETLLRAGQSLDPEVLALYLRHHVRVELKPAGDEDWQPPDGSQALEGHFHFVARHPDDDLAPLLKLLHVLFQKDYWLYFRMMQSVGEELETEIEEWALRWRTGRLEDLGFPSWDSAMRIYGFLREERLADLPKTKTPPLDTGSWDMPVWITALPTPAKEGHSVFRAVAELGLEERRGFFYAFIALANQVAVADRKPLGDAETLPATIEKAASVASLGLEHVATGNGLGLAETLRRVPLERLFRVGVNLGPEGVRPGISQEVDEVDAADEGEPPTGELH